MTETPTNTYLEAGSRSAELSARARKVMPGGNSRTTVFTAPYPAYIASAQGAILTDVEGQTRIDFVNNYTSLIHGHAHPKIVEAIGQQLSLGTAFSFPTESEVRLAELLVERVPHRPGFLDPVHDFLPRLRSLTRQLDVLLISDEIISFRLGYHGPQQI